MYVTTIRKSDKGTPSIKAYAAVRKYHTISKGAKTNCQTGQKEIKKKITIEIFNQPISGLWLGINAKIWVKVKTKLVFISLYMWIHKNDMCINCLQRKVKFQ